MAARRRAGEHSGAGSALEEALLLQLRAAGLPEPAREVRFHPVRRWRLDFTFPGRLAVEVEGATWARGRHTTGAGFEADCEKYGEAVLAGWRVLRVTGGMVADGRALGLIERALRIADTGSTGNGRDGTGGATSEARAYAGRDRGAATTAGATATVRGARRTRRGVLAGELPREGRGDVRPRTRAAVRDAGVKPDRGAVGKVARSDATVPASR